MKYILALGVPVALVAYHNAWSSIECPLLIGFGVLICIILKVKSNEQTKKERTDRGSNASE